MDSTDPTRNILLTSFSGSGGPGQVMETLRFALENKDFSVTRISRISGSLWEEPLALPTLTMRAFLDNFLVKRSQFSSPISMLRVAPNDFLKKDVAYDFAILAWLPGLLSQRDFKSLAQTPTIIRVPDENVYTGVCHYSSNCQGYLTGCESCPAVKGVFSQKVPIVLRSKIQNYQVLRKKAFVCPSNWIADRAKNSYALSGEQIEVIRNPISSEFFSNTGLNKRSKNLSVLFVASQVFDPVKGFDQIAGKLDMLARAGEMEVRVVGNPGKRAKEFPSIKFLGRLDSKELKKEFGSAWVTIVPSRSEASGNVVGESLASGTPVLARDVDGLGEIAGQVSPELLFDTDEELFSKLKNLDFRGYLAEAQRIRKVAEQHKPEIVAEQYLRLLETL